MSSSRYKGHTILRKTKKKAESGGLFHASPPGWTLLSAAQERSIESASVKSIRAAIQLSTKPVCQEARDRVPGTMAHSECPRDGRQPAS